MSSTRKDSWTSGSAPCDGRMPSGGAVSAARHVPGWAGGELNLQHGLVELLGPLRVPGRHGHVRDVALEQPAAPRRRAQQHPAVPERVDDHRAAAVRLVGRLPLHRRRRPPGPLGAPVDVIDLQMEGMTERLRRLGRAHWYVGPQVRGFGEHQHGVPDADLGVADGAVRVDVQLAAGLRAEHLGVPVHGAPGVRDDEVRGQRRRPGGLTLDPGRGGLLGHGSSIGCEDLAGQPQPQLPGEVGVGIGRRDGLAQGLEQNASNGSVIASPPLPRTSGGTRRGPGPAAPRWRARCGPGAGPPRAPAARRGSAA